METNRKSNKKFPFDGANSLSVWSINDSMEQLLEIKKILQEKEAKKWLIFYITTMAMIITAYFLYKNVSLFIIIPVSIVFFYLLYLQINRLKRLKFLELDLNKRINQVEERDQEMLEEIEDILLHSSEKMDIPEEMNMFRCKKCYSAGNQRIVCGLSLDGRKFQIWCDNCNRANLLFVKDLKN